MIVEFSQIPEKCLILYQPIKRMTNALLIIIAQCLFYLFVEKYLKEPFLMFFLFLEDNNLITPNQSGFRPKTSGTMTFYIKHHENLLHFIFDSFLTRNILKITSSVPMEDFSLNFKVFILIITCLVFCLRNERFVVTVQKFNLKGSYWIRPSETLSFLVHFILFVICITFLLVKILLSAVLKSINFTVSLFGHIFKHRITIIFSF